MASTEVLPLRQPSKNEILTEVRNKFLLLRSITLGALTFPTPFLIYFFLAVVDPSSFTSEQRFFIIMTLLLSGGIIGLVAFYKDEAIAQLKDWYPSNKN